MTQLQGGYASNFSNYICTNQPGKPIGDYVYSRSANPTRTALEGAGYRNRKGLAFSSGLAAIDCLFRSFKAGDEIITMDDLVVRIECLRRYITIQD
jgi:cystathionine beta-lyase/cystathionine gamma-synthase